MTQIFVGNLAYTTSERSCVRHLSTMDGLVCEISNGPANGKTSRVRLRRMSRWDDADEAITRLNGASLAGRQIVVNEAHSKSDPVPRRHHRQTAFGSTVIC